MDKNKVSKPSNEITDIASVMIDERKPEPIGCNNIMEQKHNSSSHQMS